VPLKSDGYLHKTARLKAELQTFAIYLFVSEKKGKKWQKQ
jgi:hypothetical protein